MLSNALPDWAQTLGGVFSIMLIAPSWGGMINGLFTLRGAWDKVREDVVLKFMVVALTAYGMATFEGPMLSLKSVNAISHFTDWTIAHVHVGALGWNGFLTFGILYWLIPRIYATPLHSQKLANCHFWIGTLGIIFYAVPMSVSYTHLDNIVYYFFSPDNYLPVAMRATSLSGQTKGASVETLLDDYREVQGLLFPFSSKISYNGQPGEAIQLENIETNVTINPVLFDFPK